MICFTKQNLFSKGMMLMATIRDVAKKASVSPATVSRVLNADPALSILPETREQVLLAAKELDYSLTKNKKKVREKKKIILILAVSKEDETEDTYYHSIRSGIISECKKRKIEITKEILVQEIRSYENEIMQQSGIISIGTIEKEVQDYLSEINQELIFLDDPKSSDRYDAVYVDLAKSTKMTLDYLAQKKYKKIGFIGGLEERRDFEGNRLNRKEIRFRTYLEWMEENHLEQYIQYELGNWTVKSGYEAANRLIAAGDLPKAILVASDPIAIGVYRALQEKKINIPEDVAIASFDDIEIAEFLTPTLTTVRFSSEAMGRMGIRILLDRLELGEREPVRVVIPTKLMKRESS